MGSGASIPDQPIDEAAARILFVREFGREFKQGTFDEAKGDDGLVSPDQVRKLVRKYVEEQRTLIRGRYKCKLALWETVRRGEVALVDAQWLINLRKSGGIVPCRQELESLSPEALVKVPESAEEESNRKIVAVSYPWIRPQHPDPDGFHLAILAKVLELYLKLNSKDFEVVAVFWDWASCYQNYFPNTGSPPQDYAEGLLKIFRTAEQNALFVLALTNINGWYTNPHTQVLMQTVSPEDPTAEFTVQLAVAAIVAAAAAAEEAATKTASPSSGEGGGATAAAAAALSIDDFQGRKHADELFAECSEMGFTSVAEYDECKMFGFATKAAYDRGIHLAKALAKHLKEEMGIRCFPGSTAVENVAVGSVGAERGVKAGFNLVAVDPPDAPYQINGAGREVFLGEDGKTYTEAGGVVTPACTELQAHLTPTVLKVGVPVRVGDGYEGVYGRGQEHRGRTGVVTKDADSDGNYRVLLEGDDYDRRFKANDLELLQKPYDAETRAYYRTPIPKMAGVVAALLALEDKATVTLAFKRNQYVRRGWCNFEKQISQMGTAATEVLDLDFLWGLMKKWDCEDDLEKFVAKYPEIADEVEVPETWKDFVQAQGEYGIAVNLVSSRDSMPMDGQQFDEELESLVFTNNSDSALVSKIYKRVFQALFESSDVEEMDFSGLGWSFPVKDLAEATLKHCAERLRILKLNENYVLQGDLSDFVQVLAVLEELDISGNRLMTGDLSVVKFPASMVSFRARGCEGLTGSIDGAVFGDCKGVLKVLDLERCKNIDGEKMWGGVSVSILHLSCRTVRTSPHPLLEFSHARNLLPFHQRTRRTGDIKALEGCTKLTDVNFYNCKITGEA